MTQRKLPWDWHPGTIPDNVELRHGAYLETTYSFQFYRSRLATGMVLGENSSAYVGCMFDMGPEAFFQIGNYSLLNGLWLICDQAVTIGSHCLLSWNVVIMDNYRASKVAFERRTMLQAYSRKRVPEVLAPRNVRPVTIGNNVWIGFDCCILPGTTIGDGAIVGARSVVSGNVPACSIFAGNPARLVRSLDPLINLENTRG